MNTIPPVPEAFSASLHIIFCPKNCFQMLKYYIYYSADRKILLCHFMEENIMHCWNFILILHDGTNIIFLVNNKYLNIHSV